MTTTTTTTTPEELKVQFWQAVQAKDLVEIQRLFQLEDALRQQRELQRLEEEAPTAPLAENSNDAVVNTAEEQPSEPVIVVPATEQATKSSPPSLPRITPLAQTTDVVGWTALMRACLWQAEDLVELLVEHEHVDLNQRNAYGQTALIIAAAVASPASEASSGNQKKKKTTPTTASNGEECNASTETEENDPAEEKMRKSGRILHHLLSQSALDVNLADTNLGWTALHHASYHGRAAVVQQLTQQLSTRLSLKSKAGKTACDLAVQRHYWDIATDMLRLSMLRNSNSRLLNYDPDREEGDDDEEDEKAEEAVWIQKVVQHRHRQRLRSALRRSPSGRRRYLPSSPSSRKLADDPALTTPQPPDLMTAAIKDNATEVRRLLATANLEETYLCGWTALMRACQLGRLEIVKILLEESQPAVRLLRNTNRFGQTALWWAVYHNREAVVDYLCVRYATQLPVNQPSQEGWTVLHVASRYGYWSLVQRLLSIPTMDVTLETRQGATAWDLVLQHGRQPPLHELPSRYQHTAAMNRGPRGKMTKPTMTRKEPVAKEELKNVPLLPQSLEEEDAPVSPKGPLLFDGVVGDVSPRTVISS